MGGSLLPRAAPLCLPRAAKRWEALATAAPLLLYLSYLIFMPKPSTHRMHDPGSIVSHIRPKVLTDNHMSQIKYNYHISNVSKDFDDSQ
jgi:hypothetical protein